MTDDTDADTRSAPIVETTVRGGVCRVAREGTEWLATGIDPGGRAPAAYNVTVPEGWNPEDVVADARRRVAAAGFCAESDGSENAGNEPGPEALSGPILLTGVEMCHARGARCGPVTAVVTAGVSNPAGLPADPSGGSLPDERPVTGTVNFLVVTDQALTPAARANLLTVVAEAKATTLLREVGVPGTTTDAVVVGSDPDGRPTRYSGAATPVGAAARACVREALVAALDARYGPAREGVPDSVADADYGVSTDVRATVFEP